MENAAFNGYDESRFQVYLGDILRDKRMKKQIEGTYDLVLANMVADVVIPLSPVFSEYMGPDSYLLVSGIVAERTEEVCHALENSGLIIREHRSEEEWNSYLCQTR
jgi:ribosomal protein L11 methyltransferase